jgi:DNA gyrase subunit B
VVNALSETLELRIWRDGEENFMRFRHGDAEAPLKVVGAAPMVDGKSRTGTEVTFTVSTKTFTMTEFDFATLEHRLRELAFLNSGVFLRLIDSRHAEKQQIDLHYEGGIEAFVTYLDRSKTALHQPPISVSGEKEGITV